MYRNTNCKLQAHRGVSTDAPENTMAAFRMAVEQGYDIIEFAPKCTADNDADCHINYISFCGKCLEILYKFFHTNLVPPDV